MLMFWVYWSLEIFPRDVVGSWVFTVGLLALGRCWSDEKKQDEIKSVLWTYVKLHTYIASVVSFVKYIAPS